MLGQTNYLLWLNRISILAVVVALLVIALGALTRLSDAGLGCPDWPGCYGHLSVPQSLSTLGAKKAWLEMIHRYFAGSFAVLVMLVAFLCALNAVKQGFSYLVLALLLFALVVYQALLGMWTVTLKLLPIVVSQHLIGGMSLLVLLWWAQLKSRYQHRNLASFSALRFFAALGLVLIFFQVALGAWTSTNYTALSCDHFPFCKATPINWDFKEAFKLFSSSGMNYEGGLLNEAARQTIQVTHRIGALLLSLYLGIFSGFILYARKKEKRLCRQVIVLLILLVLQLVSGVANVLLHLPLLVAMLHNLQAALLLCVMVAINFYLRGSPCLLK